MIGKSMFYRMLAFFGLAASMAATKQQTYVLNSNHSKEPSYGNPAGNYHKWRRSDSKAKRLKRQHSAYCLRKHKRSISEHSRAINYRLA